MNKGMLKKEKNKRNERVNMKEARKMPPPTLMMPR